MSHITAIRASEPHPTFPTLVTIQMLPFEILEHILSFTGWEDKLERTCLVSREWNNITFSCCKNTLQKQVQELIHMFSTNLDQNKNFQAALAQIDAFPSFTRFLTTPLQTWLLFLIAKGYILAVLNQLPLAEKSRIGNIIGYQIPDLFYKNPEASKLSILQCIANKDFESFYISLHSCALNWKSHELVMFIREADECKNTLAASTLRRIMLTLNKSLVANQV
jgi:hypothetical protein